MDSQIDVLIIFHAITASPTNPANTMAIENHRGATDSLLEEHGPIIEMDWYAFDIRQQIVLSEGQGQCQYFVKPTEWFQVSRETEKRTGITNDQILQGTSLKDVLFKFNEYCFFNYTQKNRSFCLVTFGDDLLTSVLPNQIKDLHLKLPQHYFQYFDLLHEFRKFYPQTSGVKSVTDMLHYLQLKEIPIKHIGQFECKNMVRVVNKLVKDSHRFINPKILNQKFQVISGAQEVTVHKRQNYKKWSAYIRGRSPEAFRNPSRKYIVRLRGLPYNAREPEIIEFLRGLRVRKENIAFLYDSDGKFTGEVFVKLLNESDYKEALSFHLGDLDKRYIEVYESSEEDFKRASDSQNPEKREYYFSSADLGSEIDKDTGIIKIRGLPLSATEEDIRNFFAGFQIKPDGIKRSIINGRPSGEAFVLFQSVPEAQKSLTLNNEKISNRFIEITISSQREYESFLSHNFINSAPAYSRDRMPNIPLEKRKNTLLMTGLPFDITKDELIAFFKSFNMLQDDVHMISNHNGKFSGNSLVSFEDEMDAQKALKTKNLTYIRNRYVELFEYR